METLTCYLVINVRNKRKRKKKNISIIFKVSSQILDCLCHMNFMYRVHDEQWGNGSNLIFESQEQNQWKNNLYTTSPTKYNIKLFNVIMRHTMSRIN